MGKKMEQVVNFRCSADTAKRVDNFCSVTGIPKKAVYEDAVNEYLDKYEEEMKAAMKKRTASEDQTGMEDRKTGE